MPSPKLQFWLRVVLRIFTFQVGWNLVFLAISFTSRTSLIGALLNLPDMGAAIFGVLRVCAV